MTTPAGVYPFATQDGKAIPLDIIKPISIITKTFVSGSDSSLVIPSGAVVGTITATKDCILRFGFAVGSLVDGAELSDSVFLPENATITLALTVGTAYVRGIANSGSIYIQLIEKWAGLALNAQYQRK